MNDDKSFTGSCGRVVDAAQNPVNRKVEGLLFCGDCRDVMTPVIRTGRSVRIVGLLCLNCMEQVQVRRGRLLQAAIELSAAPVTGGAA